MTRPPQAEAARLTAACATATLAVGVAVLIGWTFGIETMQRAGLGTIHMLPITAVTFIVASVSLLGVLLLEARLFDADAALRAGLVHEVVADDEVATRVARRAEALSLLAPQAARINKQTLRQIAGGGPDAQQRRSHFAYADAAHHREGVHAFIEKRPPRFQRG